MRKLQKINREPRNDNRYVNSKKQRAVNTNQGYGALENQLTDSRDTRSMKTIFTDSQRELRSIVNRTPSSVGATTRGGSYPTPIRNILPPFWILQIRFEYSTSYVNKYEIYERSKVNSLTI